MDWQALGAALRSADPGSAGRSSPRSRCSPTCCAPGAGVTCSPRWPGCRSRDLFSATVRRLHGRAGRPARGRGGAALPRRAPLRRRPSPAAFASIILERLVDLITVAAPLRPLPLRAAARPAQQSRGPLLGALKAGGALAGLGRWRSSCCCSRSTLHAERAMARRRPLAGAACPRGLARPRGPRPALLRRRAWPCSRRPRRTCCAIVGQSLAGVAAHRPRHPLEQPRLRPRPAVPLALPDPRFLTVGWPCPRRAWWAASTCSTCWR